MAMDPTDPSLQHLPVSLRNLQQNSVHSLNHPSDSIVSQVGHDFDLSDPTHYSTYSPISNSQVNGGQIPSNTVFNVDSQSRDLQNGHTNAQPRTPLRLQSNASKYDCPSGAQFALLTPEQRLPLDSIGRLQHDQSGYIDSPEQGNGENGGHFGGLKLIENPPNLEEWRERLFNVDETIILTEQEFQTYFPHVDNIYSHRSTQKYKRKPFVSHYWDCRLKGRPPGTPKSNDPTKKKRKRTARERDLCDVKIKITEYFPGANASLTAADFGSGIDGLSVDLTAAANLFAADTQNSVNGTGANETQPFGVLAPSANLPLGHPGANGSKYYTIQRVNGSNTGKGDNSIGGPHKHTLEESDRVKKNSVQRYLLKEAKEKKKNQQTHQHISNSTPTTTTTTTTVTSGTTATPKSQPKRPVGLGSLTAKKHSKEVDLKLFGSIFCPFVQRIWIALEIKGIPYQWIDIDTRTKQKNDAFLEASPRGVIPAIKHGNWGTFDSMVIMEYLEDLSIGHALLPLGDPQLRAHSRQWVDHINRHILPSFYTLLTSPDTSTHPSLTTTLQNQITALVNASHVSGPFFLGPHISYVDIAFAPWILRLSRILKYYRGWPDPEVGSRWETWVDAVESHEKIRNTLSEQEVLRDRYDALLEIESEQAGTKGPLSAEVEIGMGRRRWSDTWVAS